jgi:DNA polymerase V
MDGDLDAPRFARAGRSAEAPATPARASVVIGFGSPADDSGVTRLDLNDILVRNPQATFLMRVAGSAMGEAGIDAGDLVVIDRSVVAAHGHVVIAVVEREFVCRRLARQGDEVRLCAADPTVADIVAREDAEFEIWGVVTTAIKSLPV